MDGGDGLPLFVQDRGKFNLFKQGSGAGHLLALWLPEQTHRGQAGQDPRVGFGSGQPTPTLSPGQIRAKKKIF